MAAIVLPEARADLREAIRYYRAIKPPAVGMQLAARVFAAFREAVLSAEAAPRSRPEHPDITGARFVLFPGFPYLAFYTVKGADILVVSVEYATSDYVGRVTQRVAARE